jgi:hypothetical protein
MLLLLNWNLYKRRPTSRVWCLEFQRQGVFIGVQGGVTNLIKLVTCQLWAGWSSHVVGQPPSLTSTDIKLQIPCYRLLESSPVKQTRERLQSGAGQPGSFVSRPPPGPTS